MRASEGDGVGVGLKREAETQRPSVAAASSTDVGGAPAIELSHKCWKNGVNF